MTSNELPTLPGFALGAALEKLGHDRELLQRVMRALVRDYRGAPAQIDEYVRAGRWDELRRLAHTLAGLALSVGAEGLSQAARTLEREALQGQAASAEAFGRQLAQALAVLDSAPALTPSPAAPTPTPTSTDGAPALTLLAEMEGIVRRSGYTGARRLAALEQCLQGAQEAALFGRLRAEIESFQYDPALETIAALTQCLHGRTEVTP